MRNKEKIPCPHCGSVQSSKDGTRKTSAGIRRQKWFCRDCERRFVQHPLKSKASIEIICLCLDLYFRGISLRGIRDHLLQFHTIKVSQVTVMNWINKYMQIIKAYTDTLHPLHTGDTWMADEQVLNLRGKRMYLFNCLDPKSRFLLATKASKLRTLEDARTLFKESKKVAQKTARTVITDGYNAYKKSVRKEFATYDNPHPHHRYVSLKKQQANHKIERYHSSFRQRDKTMRGFSGSQKSVETYGQNFRIFYNFIRTHQKLGMTPANKAGLPTQPRWDALLLKGLENKS